MYYFEVWNQWTKRFGNVDAGCIISKYIPEDDKKVLCNDDEKRKFFQNPILAGKLIREMEKSLWLFGTSKKVSESKTKRRNRRESLKEMSVWNKVKFAWARLKTSTSKRVDKIHKKKKIRYSVDAEKIDDKNIGDVIKDPSFETIFGNNTSQKDFKYKMKWDLQATADYLNGKLNGEDSTKASKKYLKALGLSLDGASDEEIEAEANRRAKIYKKHLKDNYS